MTREKTKVCCSTRIDMRKSKHFTMKIRDESCVCVLQQFSRKKRSGSVPATLPAHASLQHTAKTPWSLSLECVQIGQVIEGVVGEVGCVCEGELRNDLGSSVRVEVNFTFRQQYI